MIKEIEIKRLMTSVEKDGKIAGLYFENELPPLELLYKKYGKSNIHTMQIKLKSHIYVFSQNELRRRGIWVDNDKTVLQDEDGKSQRHFASAQRDTK